MAVDQRLISCRERCLGRAREYLQRLELGLSNEEIEGISQSFSAKALATVSSSNPRRKWQLKLAEVLLNQMKTRFEEDPYLADSDLTFPDFLAGYFGEGYDPEESDMHRAQCIIKQYAPETAKQRGYDLFYDMGIPIGGGIWCDDLPSKEREFYLKRQFGETPKEPLLLRWLKGNFSFMPETVPVRGDIILAVD